jgi:hypothetical protein
MIYDTLVHAPEKLRKQAAASIGAAQPTIDHL